MLKKIVEHLKKHPIIVAALTVIFGTVCVYTIPVENNFHRFLVRTALCGFVSFVLYQISGEKTFESSYKNTGYVLKYFSAFLIISLIQGVLLLLGNIQSNTMVDNPVIGLLNTFLFFISVGLFEELLFRAVINDAILYELRDKKNVFIIIALVSSLVFGAIHTVDVDVTSLTAWALAIDAVIYTFSYEIEKYVTENYDCEQIGEYKMGSGAHPAYVLNYNGKKYGFLETWIGAPACIAPIEELATVMETN